MELNRNETIDSLLTGRPGPFQIKTTDERGQLVLDQLREVVSNPEPEAEFSLDEEYWVKYYLEAHGDAYGFEIAGDLDKEVSGRRGDYRVMYDGKEMVLEVEKDLKYFFKHGHETQGSVGWSNPGSIDIAFAATDSDERRDELEIRVIVASDYNHSELDVPTFDEWYNRVREIKSIKEAFVLALISNVYWEYAKGIPAAWEIQKREGEIGPVIREFLTALRENLWVCVTTGVNHVLFNREIAIGEDEEFLDLKEQAMSFIETQWDEESSWECPDCSDSLVEVGTHKWVYEPDMEAMTEGQFAEQQAAQEGGFFEEGIHGQTLLATYCFDCLLAGVGDRHASGPEWVLDNRSEVEFA